MDLLVALLVFFAALCAGLVWNLPVLLPLLAGLMCFLGVSLRRGFRPCELGRMMLSGARRSLVVLRIMALIGCVTAVWRSAGTVSFFVYHGAGIISAPLFVLLCFLLTCLFSFLLGTSFGTVSTIGVVLMMLARSGGVDPLLAAGAVISGAYFGDRCAPTSSSANMVAALTDTELYRNVKNMLRSGLPALLLCTGGYLALSLANPLSRLDREVLGEIKALFSLHPLTILPAVLLLVLCLCRVNVSLCIFLSTLGAAVISILIQGQSLTAVLHTLVFGFRAGGGGPFAAIIGGGGLVSMLSVIAVVLVTSTYSGIFEGTGLLAGIESALGRLAKSLTRFGVTLLTALVTNAFSCNQTLATMLTCQLTRGLYGDDRQRLALDMEDSVIVTAGLIPWSIAAAVPLAALGVGNGALPYAFYLFAVPLCSLARSLLHRRAPEPARL